MCQSSEHFQNILLNKLFRVSLLNFIKHSFEKTSEFDLTLLLFFLQHFEKLGINLISESIYMEEEYGLKKFKECAQIPIKQGECNTYNKAYLYLSIT